MAWFHEQKLRGWTTLTAGMLVADTVNAGQAGMATVVNLVRVWWHCVAVLPSCTFCLLKVALQVFSKEEIVWLIVRHQMLRSSARLDYWWWLKWQPPRDFFQTVTLVPLCHNRIYCTVWSWTGDDLSSWMCVLPSIMYGAKLKFSTDPYPRFLGMVPASEVGWWILGPHGNAVSTFSSNRILLLFLVWNKFFVNSFETKEKGKKKNWQLDIINFFWTLLFLKFKIIWTMEISGQNIICLKKWANQKSKFLKVGYIFGSENFEL